MPDAMPFLADLGDRAETAARRQRLEALLRNSPAALASLAGPAHLVTATNQLFEQLFGSRQLVGLGLRAALPELQGQPFFGLLDEAYHTGTTCRGREAVVFRDASPPAPAGAVHFTFRTRAVRDAAGAVSGLLLFAHHVSAPARAPTPSDEAPPPSPAQQLAAANERLAVANAELDVTSEELLVSHEDLRVTNERLRHANRQLQALQEESQAQATELRRAKQAVRQLHDELALTNAGLVDTIADSLQAVEVARTEAEAGAQRLHQLVAEAPALIAVLTGPDHVVELANNSFCAVFGHHELLGWPLLDALPELAATPIPGLCHQVYATGAPHLVEELPLPLARHAAGPPAASYWTFTCQARRNAQGAVDGVVVFAHDATGPVRARQAAAGSHQQAGPPTST